MTFPMLTEKFEVCVREGHMTVQEADEFLNTASRVQSSTADTPIIALTKPAFASIVKQVRVVLDRLTAKAHSTSNGREFKKVHPECEQADDLADQVPHRFEIFSS